MADKLTPKQEAFAWAVGVEGKSYTQAYKDVYSVKPTTADRTIWTKASEVANNGKVTVRIDELKRMKSEEMRRTFTWDMQDSFNALNFVLKKNRNDLMRLERQGKNAHDASNRAILQAVSQLDDLRREADQYTSDANRKLRAEADIAEAQAREQLMLTTQDNEAAVDSSLLKALDDAAGSAFDDEDKTET